jgi:hypothetical protein
MPGLVPGIHAFTPDKQTQDADGWDKPGHDAGSVRRALSGRPA